MKPGLKSVKAWLNYIKRLVGSVITTTQEPYQISGISVSIPTILALGGGHALLLSVRKTPSSGDELSDLPSGRTE